MKTATAIEEARREKSEARSKVGTEVRKWFGYKDRSYRKVYS